MRFQSFIESPFNKIDCFFGRWSNYSNEPCAKPADWVWSCFNFFREYSPIFRERAASMSYASKTSISTSCIIFRKQWTSGISHQQQIVMELAFGSCTFYEMDRSKLSDIIKKVWIRSSMHSSSQINRTGLPIKNQFVTSFRKHATSLRACVTIRSNVECCQSMQIWWDC